MQSFALLPKRTAAGEVAGRRYVQNTAPKAPLKAATGRRKAKFLGPRDGVDHLVGSSSMDPMEMQRIKLEKIYAAEQYG